MKIVVSAVDYSGDGDSRYFECPCSEELSLLASSGRLPGFFVPASCKFRSGTDVKLESVYETSVVKFRRRVHCVVNFAVSLEADNEGGQMICLWREDDYLGYRNLGELTNNPEAVLWRKVSKEFLLWLGVDRDELLDWLLVFVAKDYSRVPLKFLIWDDVSARLAKKFF